MFRPDFNYYSVLIYYTPDFFIYTCILLLFYVAMRFKEIFKRSSGQFRTGSIAFRREKSAGGKSAENS
ncbi:MAG: hypothetical protein R2942_06345 [Ignavibacteria bacterium]